MRTGEQAQLRHTLLCYAGDDELLAAVVPFVGSGLDAGEPVLLACSGHAKALIEPELAELSELPELPGRPGVVWLDVDDVYTDPAGAIAAYQKILDGYLSADVARIRCFGNAELLQNPHQWAEWGRYEAVVNHAFAHYPVWSVCGYDTRRVPDARLTFARCTHPQVLTATGCTPNPSYVDPAEFLRGTTRTDPDPLESTPADLDITPATPGHVRRPLHGVLQARSTGWVAADATTDNLVLAVNEVVTNALRYGRPPVHVRVWLSPARFLCTVTDQGDGIDDPYAGYLWPGRAGHTPTQGMGLWLARRYCDRVDLYHGPHGFTVRLVTHHPKTATA